MYLHCLDSVKDATGNTPFVVAVIQGFVDIAALLLEDEMSDINCRDKQGDTALHWAVLLNNPPMVQLLLQSGADISAKNANGNSAVMVACLN